MKSLQIYVYDDNPKMASRFVTAVQQGLRDAKLGSPGPQEGSVEEIEGWIESVTGGSRDNPKRPSASDDPCRDVDIVIIDYDLRHSDFQTAERLAYWLRCYSTCKAVLALNPRPDPTFELTLRRTPYSFSWADLGVYESDLKAPQFWIPDIRRAAYRPWYWPDLRDLASRIRETDKEAKANLGKTVRKFFQIPPEVEQTFPRSLLSDHVPDLDLTLEQIAARRLHKEDLDLLTKAGKGRIAAATLRWWLESVVMPPQHILIDAPHLIGRFPSLLGKPSKRRSAANRLGLPGRHLTRKMRSPEIEKCLFTRQHWLPRPAWWFPVVAAVDEIDEVTNPQNYKELEWVFAEDTSTFEPSGKCKDYLLDDPTPFKRRYVRQPTGCPSTYEPTGFLLRKK